MDLKLTLNKKWFDLIAKGEKVWEYREYKPYWRSRLLKNGTRNFNEVHFTNGYGKHRPFVRCEFLGMAIIGGGYCNPGNGETIDKSKKYFVIALGKVLETKNV